jgi:hypothetical protein
MSDYVMNNDPDYEPYDDRRRILADSLARYLRAAEMTKQAEQRFDDAIDAQFDAYNDYLQATEALTEQESE